MPKDLIKFTETETGQGIIVYKDGKSHVEEAMQVIACLKPSDVIDFIELPNGNVTLVVSDVPILDAKELVKGAKFVSLNKVPVETASWAIPLCLPAILARSLDDRDNAWAVLEQLAGRYLEKGAWSDHTKPWKDGLVAATVRTNWDEWKKLGAVSDESYWGWIKGRYFIQNGGDSWASVKGRFENWMRSADVFLRNVEERDWIANLTLNQILEIPVSKAIRCCGAITEGLFSHTFLGPPLQKALLNTSLTNADINHLIARARADRDDVPEKRVDKETGEIEFVIPSTGKIVGEDELEEYLPDIMDKIDMTPSQPLGTFWTYNYETKTFGYFEDGGDWTPGLSVQTDSLVVRRFVDQIIAACNVAADYE